MPLHRRPFFISFSGLDGAGKSTQIKKLTQDLQNQNYRFRVIWSRGGYTPFFSLLKSTIRFLLGKKAPAAGHSKQRDQMIKNPLISRLWLFIALVDLILYYGIYFRLLGLFGITVIADRYLWDTRIDFTLNFPNISFDQWILWRFLCWIHRRPDIAIYLDIPLDISLVRITQKYEPFPDTATRLEMRHTQYQTLLRQNRFTSIDAKAPVDQVYSKILEAIQ